MTSYDFAVHTTLTDTISQDNLKPVLPILS